MAQHSRNSSGNLDRNAKQASLLSSAQASQRRLSEQPTYKVSNLEEPSPRFEEDAFGPTSSQTSRTRSRHARPEQPQRESLAQFASRNIAYILSVVAVVAIVACMLVFLRACAPQEEVVEQEEDAEYVSPYNWDNLVRDGDRYAYMVDGQKKSKLGIDVSENQHEIDWDAVAADGVDFAIIRLGYRGATEGGLFLDEYYEANLAGAKAAGLQCGVYFFSQAKTTDEAVAEADYVLEQLHGTALEYPIAFDSEESVIGLEESRVANLDVETMTAVADAFCDRVEAAGYRSIIYGNAPDLSRLDNDYLKKHNVWWAEYDTPSPATEIDIIMWQYSAEGEVAGIETGVDMNIDLSPALNM